MKTQYRPTLPAVLFLMSCLLPGAVTGYGLDGPLEAAVLRHSKTFDGAGASGSPKSPMIVLAQASGKSSSEVASPLPASKVWGDKRSSTPTPAPFRLGMGERLPAVRHVEGTGRLQTVDSGTNPLFAGLLAGFGDRTGIPALLNTSFNLKGEPIVDTPADALDSFRRSGLDALYMGPFEVLRP